MDKNILKSRIGSSFDRPEAPAAPAAPVPPAAARRRRGDLWQPIAFAGVVSAAALVMIGKGAAHPMTPPQGPRGAVIAGRASAAEATADNASAAPRFAGDASAGERQFRAICAACHGPAGLGQPHQGANLHDSKFIREQSDDALVAFVKAGRQPGDPRSVLGLSMPAFGNSPVLDDGKIRDVVAFLRVLQSRPHDDADAPAAEAPTEPAAEPAARATVAEP